ncbi:HlyD family secretion protein [Aureimonas leprariae]|uniref:HlyD family secretion protein n=2 Tax=Plantimonas leprariae TaxID=2615207 RepID=A0A7V7PQL7_9HYPH|nr:HlyD family secretion protein [Aureimonas leprariae]KAB0680441.1 HlyD family secretion protein [Aureimonas leprariae]
MVLQLRSETATPAPDAKRAAPAPEPAAPKAEPTPPAAPPVAAALPKKRGAKRFLLPLFALAALGGGAWYGHYYWTEGRFLVSTDDSYVGADMSILSPKVTGYVHAVPVEENSQVKAGDALVQIDDGDYALALRSAEAKIQTKQAAISRIGSQRTASEASVTQAEATKTAAATRLAQAELDLKRASNLSRSGAGTTAQQDNAQSARDSAVAELAGAVAAVEAAKANVLVFDAQEKEAAQELQELQVARDQAARDLSFTTLRAPYDGVVGNLEVQPGDYVSPGRRLAAVVPIDKVYVDANFKETQLAEIVPGQKVAVEIDAIPGREFEGTVKSVSPASGSVFSLLPTDNATGNFTKVIQRVPVRIEIDHARDLAGRLRPGLSSVVKVDIRTTPDPEHATAVNGDKPAPAVIDAAKPDASR